MEVTRKSDLASLKFSMGTQARFGGNLVSCTRAEQRSWL